MVKKFYLLILIVTFLHCEAISQDSTKNENQPSARIDTPNQSEQVYTPVQKSENEYHFTTDRELILSCWILAFGFGVVLLETIIIIFINYRNHLAKAQSSSNRPYIVGPNVTKLIGVTLIIVSASILITSGFTGKEIAPIVGLLGTVAGYLLGKSSEVKPQDVKPAEK